MRESNPPNNPAKKPLRGTKIADPIRTVLNCSERDRAHTLSGLYRYRGLQALLPTYDTVLTLTFDNTSTQAVVVVNSYRSLGFGR